MAGPLRKATEDKSAYVTWAEGDEEGKAIALRNSSRALAKVEPAMRGAGSNVYLNVAPGNVSVRDEFNRSDYESFRYGEIIPKRIKDIIAACMGAYRKHGLVHNVIDLMADFAVQGIDLVHTEPEKELFSKAWFRKVRARERSERFLNLFYRTANVIVQRETAYLPLPESREMAQGADIHLGDDRGPKPPLREIPWRYVFLNPLLVELQDDELSTFVGEDARAFVLTLPPRLVRKIRNPKTDAERNLIARLPPAWVRGIRSGSNSIDIDPARVQAFYYKKDDWQPWAEPMLLPVLANLNQLEKMQLADMAALDGAISNIRVWRLGSLKDRILPSEATIVRLSEMLVNNVGGGVMDLVWGPDIDLIQTNTDVHHFLGASKYEPVLNLIFQGLGIPPTLTGSANTGSFTNNFISLKTLIERLEYGRSVLEQFWQNEVVLLQKAMRWDAPPKVVFDRMTLNDEAAEKKLLMDLADRNFVSWEYVVERFGADPEIEKVRLAREAKARAEGGLPPMAGPFHDPQQDHGMKKIFAQSGAYAPSEMGVSLSPKKEGEKTPTDEAIRTEKAKPKPTGVSGQGRPKLSKDSQKRKKKRVQPRRSVKASEAFVRELADAHRQYSEISRHLSEAYLKARGRRNLRELTDDEADSLEHAKFAALVQFPVGGPVTRESLARIVGKPALVPDVCLKMVEACKASHLEKYKSPPTLEDVRRYQASVYVLCQGDFVDGED